MTKPVEWKKSCRLGKVELLNTRGSAFTAEKIPRPTADKRKVVPVAELRTERLLLRQWRDEDLEPFAELNGDAETMRFFPSPPSRAESDALAERARRQIEDEGWGLWAVEVAGGASFIGFVGLARPS